ncbi:MAG: hypothetical protein NTW21_11745 [Verrucomicrobia bacterium]|nr:hypothetical protein [Verrucomicrobiota bacterium]
MKTNTTIIMRGALCSIVALTAISSCTTPETAPSQGSSPITWTTSGKPTGKMDVLYVQNAKNVTLNQGKLVMRGVNPNTVCFTDRPDRLAGHLPTRNFVPLWSQGKDSFLKDPPNATLSVFSGDKVSDVVVEISNPVLSGDTLTYDAKVLEGAASVKDGECSLFIDIIGCPRTPCSYAGAARRFYR